MAFMKNDYRVLCQTMQIAAATVTQPTLYHQ